jgi:hypothetical protein
MVLDALYLTGTWRIRMHEAASGRLLSDRTYRNVICVNGKNYLAAWLNIETPAQTLTTIYGAVGTNVTAPASGDTQLGTELARVVLGSNSRFANVVTMDFFFNTGQGNGTWTEAGLFLGATAAANNGSLLSHVAVSETKTNLITATLEFSLQVGS